jgi:fructose/tagatose bisphosphate aldolase
VDHRHVEVAWLQRASGVGTEYIDLVHEIEGATACVQIVEQFVEHLRCPFTFHLDSLAAHEHCLDLRGHKVRRERSAE